MVGLLYCGYTFGSIFITFVYQETKNWRHSILFANVIPIIVIMGLAYYFVQDTPKSLIKSKSAEEACRILNWISNLNGKGDSVFTET